MNTSLNNFLNDRGYWLIFAAIALVIVLGLTGCGPRNAIASAPPPHAAATTPCITDSDCEKIQQPKPAFYCAGITTKGIRCARRVKHDGDYCWMHIDQDKRRSK